MHVLNMIFKFFPSTVGFIAQLTCITYSFVHGSAMLLKSREQTKIFITFVALKISLIGVNQNMIIQN